MLFSGARCFRLINPWLYQGPKLKPPVTSASSAYVSLGEGGSTRCAVVALSFQSGVLPEDFADRLHRLKKEASGLT